MYITNLTVSVDDLVSTEVKHIESQGWLIIKKNFFKKNHFQFIIRPWTLPMCVVVTYIRDEPTQ